MFSKPIWHDRRYLLIGWVAVFAIWATFAAGCSPADPTGGVVDTLPPTTVSPSTTITSVPEDQPAASTSTTSANIPEETTVPPVVPIAPNDDASEIVAGAPAGSTFEFAPGIHRLFAVRPKDGTTFLGLDGAILSGAIELEMPVAVDGGWRYDGHEFTGGDHGHCIDGYDACGLTQDVFVDDVMLWQVTDRDELAPGTWFWEGSEIFIFDDPTNRRVELSVEDRAFDGDSDAVTIRNLVIEKYATPAQNGAIQSTVPGGDRGTNWLIEDVEVRGAHGAGIRAGDGTTIRRAYVHHNGQLGIAVSRGIDVLIEDSEIAFNNIAGFRWSWEGGGGKFTRTDGLIVRNTYSHDNIGPGLWTDIDAINTLYESNRVVNNTGPGIYHEISYVAIIRDNVVEGNGFDFPGWLWGAGIQIAASSDVEVVGNEVRGNANAIAGLQQARGEGAFGPHLLSGLKVHNNTIAVADGRVGIVTDTGDSAVFTERGNQFDDNTYQGVDGRIYSWGGSIVDRHGWVDAGQDVNGTWE
jgi:parallel beta-helix repeat protein